MAEYIELINRLRQEAEFEAYLQPHSANETPKLLSEAADVIEKLSKERKKGKWIHFSRSDECSVCGYDTGKYEAPTWFCPHCGAEMRGET